MFPAVTDYYDQPFHSFHTELDSLSLCVCVCVCVREREREIFSIFVCKDMNYVTLKLYSDTNSVPMEIMHRDY
jgi:hypothetical protein